MHFALKLVLLGLISVDILYLIIWLTALIIFKVSPVPSFTQSFHIFITEILSHINMKILLLWS
jgi:hypothetical protein